MNGTDLNEHGNEGIEVIVKSPAITGMTILYVTMALIAAAVVWSFFGKADVVIACPGEISPMNEPRRVYSPVSGELMNMYFIEGESVSKGTIMARIKAPEAIVAATLAQSAAAEFKAVKRDADLVPDRKKLLAKQLELLSKRKKYQLESIGNAEEQLKAFDESQKLKTEIIQDRIHRADDAVARTKKTYDNYKRMLDAGAVSKKEFEDQALAWKTAVDAGKSARLQASSDFSKALDERREKAIALDRKRNDVLKFELEIRQLEDLVKRMSEDAAQKLELARVKMEAARQVTFDDLDAENLLKVVAPADGIITEVAATQAGDKVLSAKPLLTISGRDDKCLLIRISDQDRAFVESGMRVRIKVNAFPYMRFGFLDGQLESIRPIASQDKNGEGSFYEGKVIFDRTDAGELLDFFAVQGEKRPVRYGMQATAEIVVDRRRLIEFALDPFRKLKP